MKTVALDRNLNIALTGGQNWDSAPSTAPGNNIKIRTITSKPLELRAGHKPLFVHIKRAPLTIHDGEREYSLKAGDKFSLDPWDKVVLTATTSKQPLIVVVPEDLPEGLPED